MIIFKYILYVYAIGWVNCFVLLNVLVWLTEQNRWEIPRVVATYMDFWSLVVFSIMWPFTFCTFFLVMHVFCTHGKVGFDFWMMEVETMLEQIEKDMRDVE